MMMYNNIGVFDVQKARNRLQSTLEQLYMKAVSFLTSPEAVAEQSSLSLETVRSHRLVGHGLYCALSCEYREFLTVL